VEVTTALIVQDEQVVALRLVGSKDALVATVSQYFFAPVTAPQLNIGVVETPVAPFVGDESNGAESTVPCVVNDHCDEYWPWTVGLTVSS
jgi:hypothetical protein